MKNKIILISFAIAMLFVITGCNNESDSFSQFERYEKNIICDEINDIVDINNALDAFITSDGRVYILDFKQKFSNDKNCKLINSETKMKRFLKEYIVGEDGRLYYMPSFDSTNIELRKIYHNDKQHYLDPNKYILGLEEYKTNIYDPYVRFEDFEEGFSNDFLKILDENGNYNPENEYFHLKDGEEIEYIIDKTIKTNLAIYVYDEKIINEKECEKYADIKCEYSKEFFENPNFIYDGFDSLVKSELSNIKFYKIVNEVDDKSETHLKNYTFAITSDGKVYTNHKYR